jgi:bla regulator protein BlaR1
MSAAELLLTNTLISALGWTLVHFLWQGCLIALIYWLICALAPRHAATLRYWTGLAGMLLCLFTVALTFALSYSAEAGFEFEPITATAVNPFLVLSGHFPNTLALLETGIEPALPWVVLLWFLGCMCFSIRALRDWLAVSRLLQDGIVSSELQLQIALEKLKTILGVQLPVRLLVSTRVAVPLAIGWLRPVILIPVSVLVRLPQDQLEMILAHELGHIRRGDFAFNLLQIILETLLFYHPAISWMSQRVREEREHRCDDLVVRFCGKPATYARALTNLEVIRSPVLTPAIAATGGNLLARIKLIINKEIPRKGSNLTQFALVAVAGIFVAFGAQQGYSLSTELTRIAGSAQLQASDVQWKTWGRSRQAWSEGVTRYAQSTRKQSLAALKSAALSPHQLPERIIELKPAPIRQNGVYGHLLLRLDDELPNFRIESYMELDHSFSASAMMPPAAIDLPGAFAMMVDNQPPVGSATVLSDRQTNAAEVETVAGEYRHEIEPINESTNASLTPVKTRSPNYPWQARRKGIEGFVKLEFSIDADGKVTDVEVLDALPVGIFEKAASKALEKWTFEKFENSAVRYRQVFDFELQDVERGPPRSRPCALTGSRTCGTISPAVFVVWVNDTTRRPQNLEVK